MKFVIVLFAVMAVARAYPGILSYSAPVSVPEPWPAPAPAYLPVPAPAPSYVKVAAAPAYVKVAVPQVHAPEVHHAIQIPQQQSIPPPHPQPLNIKVPQIPAHRIPYHPPGIPHPHLIGVEQEVEPVKVVKAVHAVHAVHAPVHQPWD